MAATRPGANTDFSAPLSPTATAACVLQRFGLAGFGPARATSRTKRRAAAERRPREHAGPAGRWSLQRPAGSLGPVIRQPFGADPLAMARKELSVPPDQARAFDLAQAAVVK